MVGMETQPIVVLHENQTHVSFTESDRKRAFEAAFWVTASPHEWVWTPEQQALMAQFVLWATQRLGAIEQLASGRDLVRGGK